METDSWTALINIIACKLLFSSDNFIIEPHNSDILCKRTPLKISTFQGTFEIVLISNPKVEVGS